MFYIKPVLLEKKALSKVIFFNLLLKESVIQSLSPEVSHDFLRLLRSIFLMDS